MRAPKHGAPPEYINKKNYTVTPYKQVSKFEKSTTTYFSICSRKRVTTSLEISKEHHHFTVFIFLN